MITYASKIGQVADSLGGGNVLAEGRVGQVRVVGLVVGLVVVVCVTIFPPVSVESLWLKGVLVHFCF